MNLGMHRTVLPHTDPDASRAAAGRDGVFARAEAGAAGAVQEPAWHPYGIRDRAFRPRRGRWPPR